MRRIATVLVVSLLLAGCAPKRPSATVSGTITYNGKPVNGAMLHFYPKEGNAPEAAMIPVDQDGKFQVGGVPPGDYKVVVEPSAGTSGPSTGGKPLSPEMKAKMQERAGEMKEPPTIRIPKKYLDRQTTTLSATVGQGQQELTLQLVDP
jgi:hypothetical protein